EESTVSPVVVGQNYRTPDGRAELILFQVSFGIEIVVGIQRVVAKKLPRAAVERVCTRFGGQVDDATQDLAKLCLVIVGLNLEFQNIVNRRLDRVGVSESAVVVHAVQKKHVAAVGLPVDRGIGK